MIQKHLLTIAIAATMMMGAQGARAQGTAINTTGTAAAASAILDVNSSSQGMLVPRIANPTTAISSPATGLMVYNTTTNQYNYYNGTAWTAIGGATLSNGSAAGQIYTTGSSPFAVQSTPVTVSGDATLSSAGALTLATVNSNVGTFGSTTQSPQITVDAKGRITAISNQTIAGGSSQFVCGGISSGASVTVPATGVGYVLITTAGGTVTLPAANAVTAGRVIFISNETSSTCSIVYKTAAGSTIWDVPGYPSSASGTTGLTITNCWSMAVSDGISNWYVTGNN